MICYDQLLILNLQAGRTDSGSTVGRQPRPSWSAIALTRYHQPWIILLV